MLFHFIAQKVRLINEKAINIHYIPRSEVGLVAKKCYGNYQPPYGPQEKNGIIHSLKKMMKIQNITIKVTKNYQK